MRQTRIELDTDGGAIDGVMCGPERLHPPAPGVVVCHPHPLLGGNADHPVVFAVCAALAERGIVSLRFNFRVATRDNEALTASAAEDVAATLEGMRQWDIVNPHRVAVAGHSFGAAAILHALPALGDVKAISLIAPPVRALASSDIGGYNIPRQVLAGSRDRLAPPEELRAAAGEKDQAIKFEIVEGADHNFTSTAIAVAALSASFLASHLKG